MSENFKNLRKHAGMSEGSKEAKRDAAVGAALTLINTRVAASPGYASILNDEMERLSTYADLIEAALKIEK